MRRRDFITFLAGGITMRPLAAHAQQKAMPVIGFLSSLSPGPSAPFTAAFLEGLSETAGGEEKGLVCRFVTHPRCAPVTVERST